MVAVFDESIRCDFHPMTIILFSSHKAIGFDKPFTLPFTDADLPEIEEVLKQYFEAIKNEKVPECKFSWKCSKLCRGPRRARGAGSR